jgi:hypothetical protein
MLSMRWGCYSFFLLAAVSLAMAARTGNPLRVLPAVAWLALVGLVLLRNFLVDVTITVRREFDGATVERTASWHLLLPKARKRLLEKDIQAIECWEESVMIQTSKGTLVIGDFTPGSLGAWQVERSAAAIGGIVGREPARAAPSDER